MLTVRHPSVFLGHDRTEGCEKPYVLVISTPAGKTLETLRYSSVKSATDKLRLIERDGQYQLTEK